MKPKPFPDSASARAACLAYKARHPEHWAADVVAHFDGKSGRYLYYVARAWPRDWMTEEELSQ